MRVRTKETPQLQKRLGLPFAIAIAAGSVIGSGIMRTPGVIANEVPIAEIAKLLWVLGGVYVLLSCNVAAELTAALPKAGGIYVPVREAYGDGLGMLTGWANWTAYIAGSAALALACADFLGTIFDPVAANKAIVAAIILFAVTVLNWVGVQEGRWIQIIGSAIKIILLVGVIIAAFIVDPVITAADPAPTVPLSALGIVAVITAFQIILGAYDGWIGPAAFAEEDKDPGRNIPRALFRSAFLVIAVYLALNLALFSILDMTTLRDSDLPVALLIEALLGPTGNVAVALLATFMALITLNGLVMSAPRILFAMARDRLFLHEATRVNRGGTPWVALLCGTAVAVPLLFSGGYVFVFKIQTALGIFAGTIYCAAFFTLRRRCPDLPRPFRAIGYPALPALILLINAALFISVVVADPMGGIWIAALIAICLPVGMALGRRRRAIVETEPLISTAP